MGPNEARDFLIRLVSRRQIVQRVRETGQEPGHGCDPQVAASPRRRSPRHEWMLEGHRPIGRGMVGSLSAQTDRTRPSAKTCAALRDPKWVLAGSPACRAAPMKGPLREPSTRHYIIYYLLPFLRAQTPMAQVAVRDVRLMLVIKARHIK